MLNQSPSSISYLRQEELENYGSKEDVNDSLVFTKHNINFNDIKYSVNSLDDISKLFGYIKKEEKNYYGETWNFYDDKECKSLVCSAYTLKGLKGKISESIY